jgi:hypothetical protein
VTSPNDKLSNAVSTPAHCYSPLCYYFHSFKFSIHHRHVTSASSSVCSCSSLVPKLAQFPMTSLLFQLSLGSSKTSLHLTSVHSPPLPPSQRSQDQSLQNIRCEATDTPSAVKPSPSALIWCSAAQYTEFRWITEVNICACLFHNAHRLLCFVICVCTLCCLC